MAPLVRRSLFKSNKVGPKPPTAEEASSNLIPTNELIVNEWKENKSKKEDVFLLKLIDEMPKDGKKKRKGSKGGKGSKKMYAGKLKMKTCPHVIGNLYCPEHVVDKFRANHEVKHEEEMTKLFVYHKKGVNDLEFVGNITCNTHPDTPASYLDNGLFIVTANDDSIPGGMAVATTEYRTHIEQLTFYELRWFMDHPYFITLVLTVIADHTVMHVKKKKNRDGSEALTKKPKPTSFIGKDYKSNLESLLDNLSKVLVFMTRKVNPDKFSTCPDKTVPDKIVPNCKIFPDKTVPDKIVPNKYRNNCKK
ncbi:uncharacterized protein LOC142352445 isoform X3 [Convolutriloba macropyga]|uniref:uncharacterized protein LOC142352445 isoform X3 n=1 Tax=Convolutriloba macropyga TaxID=536237 RepID=UPI003F5277A3